MPEMFAFAASAFVCTNGDRLCDTVFPVRGRRVTRRSISKRVGDGQAHGGCQARCLIFWKEAWLKRISCDSPSDDSPRVETNSGNITAASAAGCTESDVWARAKASDADGGEPVYTCQATQLPYATADLAWWDIRQYVEDYRSGNVGLWRILCGLVYAMYYNLSQAGIGLGPRLRWFYDKFHVLWRGTQFPRRRGNYTRGTANTTATLNLQPGDLVRVKSQEEILRTAEHRQQESRIYSMPRWFLIAAEPTESLNASPKSLMRRLERCRR